MNRILDLQKMDNGSDESLNAAVAGSTSSYAGCTCSTASNTGCGSSDVIIAL
ncbi:class III lanthipeptide [Luteimonas sp. S4-F44]|uniref:class III lanthipeptide n=1 Tax=Luteimonas sp. S4-F44 TaxID=2925842 RepID=UPI001F53CF79|nr:class III lanthipeptide [Luteimonas sp. S4-F44]UNK42020.1 class III lanthipeptide [Luteimonas sp. S4-F44]